MILLKYLDLIQMKSLLHLVDLMVIIVMIQILLKIVVSLFGIMDDIKVFIISQIIVYLLISQHKIHVKNMYQLHLKEYNEKKMISMNYKVKNNTQFRRICCQ
jgi:hypothetical protein